MSNEKPNFQEAVSRQEPQGCLLIILRILCVILDFLCKYLGRYLPFLCQLEKQICGRINPQPPTTELTTPTGCKKGTQVKLGGTTYPFLVEIRGKASGGSFVGYKLGYRTGSGAFIESDDKIVYPNGQTNAALGVSLFPTPVGPATGTLGYLNALYLLPGHYELQLRTQIGGTTRLLAFDLERDYVEIKEVANLAVPDSGDENSQLAEAAGGAVIIEGSADTGGCADNYVRSYKLEYAEGHLSRAAIIALPSAGRTLIDEVDYTANPLFTSMTRPRNGELTLELFPDTITILGVTFPYGNSRSKPWPTGMAGLNGRYTTLLTVKYSDGSTAHETQQVWIDNRACLAWISKIEQQQGATWVEVSGCNPISIKAGGLLRFKGAALDPLILPALPATHPNNNFGSYSMVYYEDGLGVASSADLTLSGAGPVGAVNLDPNGDVKFNVSGVPPISRPDITVEGDLATWDITKHHPCAYTFVLSVSDTSRVDSSPYSHSATFYYALTLAE